MKLVIRFRNRIKMDKEALISKRDELRVRWQSLRKKRLGYKTLLIDKKSEPGSSGIKKTNRDLKKMQRLLSKEIRHLEKKIIRRINEERNREKKISRLF